MSGRIAKERVTGKSEREWIASPIAMEAGQPRIDSQARGAAMADS
jgi:hypothetical protein